MDTSDEMQEKINQFIRERREKQGLVTPRKVYKAIEDVEERIGELGREIAENMETQMYIERIRGWHHDRNLIDGSTDEKQIKKLKEEFTELIESCEAGKSPIDDIGDMIVVLTNIAERNGLTILECLAHAWEDIKDRKGKMIDGIFVKEADLHKFQT